jgi:sec-independent protein translocase protein TatB
MFSWSEILLIAVVALIFIGPKELPGALQKMGQMAGKLRRSAEEFRRHFDDAVREAGYQDLHKDLNDLRHLNPSTQLRTVIDNAITQDYAPRPQPAGTQASAPPSFGSATPGQVNGVAAEAAAPAALGGVAREGAEPAAEPSKNHAAPMV